LFLGAEGRFNVIADFAERFDMGGAFLLDEHEVTGFGRINDIADLAGREREGDVGEFLAEHGAFDPAPIATLVTL
jgi:hypothetical protein